VKPRDQRGLTNTGSEHSLKLGSWSAVPLSDV
jgi:hypothetical protein